MKIPDQTAHNLIRLKVTPNLLSWMGALCALVCGIWLTQGWWGWGCLFALLSGGMDAMDGRLARLTGTASQQGAVLDSTLDRYADFFVYAGLGIYFRGNWLWLLISLLALLGAFMMSYSTAKADAIHLTFKMRIMKREQRWIILLWGLFLSWWPFHSVEPIQIALALTAGLSNGIALFRLSHLWYKARS